jgi:hypothetical protein
MLQLAEAYRVHNDCINTLMFFPDSRTLLTACQEWDEELGDLAGVLKIWRRDGMVWQAFRDPDFGSIAALSENGHWIAWGGPVWPSWCPGKLEGRDRHFQTCHAAR